MNNDRIRVSQAYCDTYSEIVKDILKNHLRTAKDVWLEDTKDIHNVVIPNMHPFDAIRWITRQCRTLPRMNNAPSIPNYNFYETTKGYRFKTMHSQAARIKDGPEQLDSKDQQMSFTIPTGRQDRNYLGEMMTAQDYKFLRTGDTYEAIQKGMFASKSIQHDSYHKKFSIKATNYDRGYKPDIEGPPAGRFISNHIPYNSHTVYVPDGTKYPSQHPLIENNSESFTEFPDSRIFFTSTGSKHAYDFADDKGVRTKDNQTDQLTTPLWHMQQSHDRYMQLMLSVWGVSGLQVGDMVGLETPVVGSDRRKDKTFDYRFSVPYYITKLVHRIDLRADVAEYFCDLVCSAKDGSLTKLPRNGNLAGADGKTGSIKDFSGSDER